MMRLGYPTLAHKTYTTKNQWQGERFIQTALWSGLIAEAYTTTARERCYGSWLHHTTGRHTRANTPCPPIAQSAEREQTLEAPHQSEGGLIPLRDRTVSLHAVSENSVGEQPIAAESRRGNDCDCEESQSKGDVFNRQLGIVINRSRGSNKALPST